MKKDKMKIKYVVQAELHQIDDFSDDIIEHYQAVTYATSEKQAISHVKYRYKSYDSSADFGAILRKWKFQATVVDSRENRKDIKHNQSTDKVQQLDLFDFLDD